MYHPEGIACPSPCNKVTNFTFLWKAWVISSWKKFFGCPRQCFFFGGGGGGGTAPFNHLLYLISGVLPRGPGLPPRKSNLIYKYTSISLFLGIRVPCGTKFLRQFIFFRIGDFLSSVRELIIFYD